MFDISLLITSGNGPSECHQAVAGILNRLTEEAQAQGLEVTCHSSQTKHGAKSAVILLHGAQAQAFANGWIGTILWRAKSTLRPQHKRANWFVGIYELAAKTQSFEQVDPGDVTFESFRAGGPGGQHQNTTDSAVRATHRPSGLTVIARDQRSQHRNKALALDRLGQLLAAQARADLAERRAQSNQLHQALERGNPVRRFKGPQFRPDG